jgi:hypothetical protein
MNAPDQPKKKTFLTSLEIEALGTLLPGGATDQTAASPTIDNEPLIQRPAIPPDAVPADTIMCIDFGTSFSKAFACLDTKQSIPQIIDLPIGEYGKSEKPLLTPSEMLIDDRVIYFGGVARKLFDDSEADIERLIDSIKQYMTLGTDVSNLAKIRLDATKDPDQKFFSTGHSAALSRASYAPCRTVFGSKRHFSKRTTEIRSSGLV